MIAIIGTSDRPCWLAEAYKIFLFLLLCSCRLSVWQVGRCVAAPLVIMMPINNHVVLLFENNKINCFK